MGCNQPVWRCDVDHGRSWQDGGPTCAGNCGLFCRHHELKTAKLWHFDRRPDGTGTLTSPAGHAYHTEPHRYPLPPPRPPAGDEPTSLEASALDEPQAPTAPDPPAAPPKPPPPYDDEPPF